MAADRRKAIQDFMSRHGLNMASWARKAGFPESTLRSYLGGRSNTMTLDKLDRLAIAADTTVAEIIGERAREPRVARDMVPIKSLEVKAAMGGGFEVVEEPEGPPYYFRREWIEQILSKQPGRLRIIDLGGDSMRPTISDGDKGLVNLDADFESGRVYSIWDGHGLIAKRVELIPSRTPTLRIISDNSSLSEPYTVVAEEVRIIGMVVWRGGLI